MKVAIEFTNDFLRICYGKYCYSLMQAITLDTRDPVLEMIAQNLKCSTQEIVDAAQAFFKFFPEACKK